MQNDTLAFANTTSGSLEHSDSQFIPPLDGHFNSPRISLQTHPQQAASPLHGKCHFGPARKQMGVKDNAVLTHAQARNTEHRCLPEAAKSGHMHAAGGITHVVRQIDLCGLAEIGLRQGSIAEPGGNEGIEGGDSANCRALCEARSSGN